MSLFDTRVKSMYSRTSVVTILLPSLFDTRVKSTYSRISSCTRFPALSTTASPIGVRLTRCPQTLFYRVWEFDTRAKSTYSRTLSTDRNLDLLFDTRAKSTYSRTSNYTRLPALSTNASPIGVRLMRCPQALFLEFGRQPPYSLALT